MKPAKISLNKNDRVRLVEASIALAKAQTAFNLISTEARTVLEGQHAPHATLSYCLKWGNAACGELLENSTPQTEASVWVTPEQLAAGLNIKLDLVHTLTKKKILVKWQREGQALYDLKESQERFKVWEG